MIKTLTFLLFFLSNTQLFPQNTYKTILMRAAPGKLLELIDHLKSDISKHETYGIAKPRLMRHSQGDHWDLLLIFPIESIADYYQPENTAKREASFFLDKPYGNSFYDLLSFHEDFFVEGPSHSDFKRVFDKFDYYHVEMFIALPGKQNDLLNQRQMENVYLKEINRDPNFIFKRMAGSEWDIFTIGCYRDIKHFAESADIPFDAEERAALKAGFKGVNFIGSYLRELILEHHDTLAGVVK